MWTVVDLLRSPAYAVPLVVNLTGSVWFFLLIGKAGRCCLFFLSLGLGVEEEGGYGGLEGGSRGRGEWRRSG